MPSPGTVQLREGSLFVVRWQLHLAADDGDDVVELVVQHHLPGHHREVWLLHPYHPPGSGSGGEQAEDPGAAAHVQNNLNQ